MGAVMVDIPTGLLALILTVITALHLAGYYIFFYINLEKIENYLCDIEMFSLNRDFYGDSLFGRRMRETFVMLVAVAPEIFWRQERIPRQKTFQTASPTAVGSADNLWLDDSHRRE
ncbi:hypothetical protein [Pseudomonas sp. PS02290]|uniref:hypothetical protein n=1 Tax=Pseudomonas sp. PS02290 TaxID=2991430 RepID=UPI002499E86D|nr:hypothetical protein [Pseudomonas sp. PS02290]